MFKFFNKKETKKSGDQLFNEALSELNDTLRKITSVDQLLAATDRISEINKKMERANDQSMNELVEKMLRV